MLYSKYLIFNYINIIESPIYSCADESYPPNKLNYIVVFKSSNNHNNDNKQKSIVEENKFKIPTFIVTKVEETFKESQIERLDYVLKHFKKNLINYYIKKLNDINKSIRFYLPDYKRFTSNIKYEDNYKMFQTPMRDILIKYGQKNKGSNENILNKIDIIKPRWRFIYVLYLSKTYREIIEEYYNSKAYKKDIEKMKTSFKKKKYEMLGDKNNKFNFISLMENGKK